MTTRVLITLAAVVAASPWLVLLASWLTRFLPRVRRAAKWVRVSIQQLPDEDAEALVLIVAACAMWGAWLIAKGTF